MAVRLLRCKRCRQPILADARCCPHCAVSRPARRRKLGEALMAALLVAATLLWLHRSGVGGLDRAPPQVTASGASDERAHDFATACRERGGTVVAVEAIDGRTATRCATAFDDSVGR